MLIKIGDLHFLNFLLLFLMGISLGNNVMAQDNEEGRNGYSYYPQGDIVIADNINSRNLRWYKLIDIRRSEAEGQNMWVIYGQEHQDVYVNNGYGKDPDCLLWTFIKGPSEYPNIQYYLYNKKCGFRIAIHRGKRWPDGSYSYNDASYTPGYDAFMKEERRKAFGFYSGFDGRKEREFSLVYYDYEGGGTQVRRFENNRNSNGLEFGQTNNWKTESVIWKAIDVSATQTDRFDYYPLINSRGAIGALHIPTVNQLVKKHFAMETSPSDATTQAVKDEANRLRSGNQTDYVGFDPNKYYRIRAAHIGFFDAGQSEDISTYYTNVGTSTWKRPVLYTNPSDNSVAWRLSDGDNSKEEELWKITLKEGNFTNGGTIVLTNKKTGKRLRIKEMVDGAATIGFKPVNSKYYPGHYQIWDKISGEWASLHFTGHTNGMGTGGKTDFYLQGDNNSYDFFYDANTNRNNRIHGASVVIFDPSTVEVNPIVPLTEGEKIDVWRLIWGSGKAGGIKADDNNDATTDDIGKLARLWKNGSPNLADIPALRAERDRLLSFTPDQRVPFIEGYYRIKNGHDGFNQKNKNARLFESTTDNRAKWENNKTGDETLYYLKKTAEGKYQMINVRTGRAYSSATTASSKEATFPSMEITPVNAAKYAGYYKIISPTNTTYPISNSGHATPHGNGDGDSGTLKNYHSPDGGVNAKYNFTLPDNTQYAGASAWMFERETNVPALTPEEQEKVKAVLNAKNVVDGFTQAQLTEFERLETVHAGIGGSGIAPALKAEVQRLLALPYTSRIQYSNGFYVIKNGSYDYYERKHNKVLLMNARQEGDRKIDRIAWKKKAVADAGNEADEVWYVERDGNTNKYTFTNVKTLTRIQGFTSTRNPHVAAFLGASDAKIVVTQVDQANRPAQFLLQTNKQGANNDITANPEGPGSNFDGTQTGPILSWWGHPNNMDSHSTWMLRKVSENTLQGFDARQTEVKRAFEKSENKYGGFTTRDLSRLKTITSPYELVKEINNLRKSTNRIASKNGFVRIFCAAIPFTQNKHLYVNYNANKMKWHNHNATAVDEIWVLGGTAGSTTRTLMNPNTKTYLNNVNGTLGTTKNIEVVAIDPNLYPGVYEIKVDGSTLHYIGHALGAGIENNVANYRGGTNEQYHFIWAKNETTTDAIAQFSTSYIEVAKNIEIRPKSTAQWVTFNYPFAVKMPEAFAQRNAATGIWACIENSETYSRPNGTDFVFVRPQVGQYVAKEVPMVIEMKPAKNLTLEIVEDAALPSSGVITRISSIWRGVLAPTAVNLGDYVMRNLPQGNGWYPINNAADLKVAANKVYLPKSTAASNAKFFDMKFENLETTGIDSQENQEGETQREVIYYDLAGRRVDKPAKGVYITSEGKKVVFK